MLSEYSTKNDDERAIKRAFKLKSDGYRNEFERDYTRILHSRAFRRMRHKTQVFIRPENDHICTRLEHSLYLASIGKTIAKKLGLNIDLVQAIAIGHDLGHAPFGHEGEKYLNELGKNHGINFKHELHSLRVVDEIDSPYPDHKGLNLTFGVRDGIACHNGESFEQILEPVRNKTAEQLKGMKKIGESPATLEGCVVRFADKIAYLGRDLEDAWTVNIIKKDEIPKIIKERLGLTNREIINVLIRDLVDYSCEKEIVGFSERIFEAVSECKKFNYEKIYSNPKVTQPFKQIKHAIKAMFEEFAELIKKAQEKGDLKEIEKTNHSDIYKVLALFLKDDIREWTDLKPERMTIDFIAGMTDNYFITKYREIFLPQNTV